MGLVKRDWEEFLERGWSAPDKLVCSECVEDEFLKGLIQSNASARQCDYCGKRTRQVSAAPVEVIMPAVASALNYFYAEPTAAGVPYDGGWVFEPIYTADALMEIPFDAHDDLFEDVVDAFSNTAWVAAADGHWASSHRNEYWSLAWQSFAETVKHRSRYFFQSAESDEDDWIHRSPVDVLELVGRIAGELGLLASIPAETTLFRVRERVGNADWASSADELSAPPNYMANAGRMNPAGISYLYVAKTESGALAEVLRGPPCRGVVARFATTRTLELLDLTRLPALPSIFDEEKRMDWEAILFLSDFVADISRPVHKDGREHITYVPSQVVSEYFSQVFTTAAGERLDGIAYPSAISDGSVNVALFPRGNHDAFGDVVTFSGAHEVSLETWDKFSKAICG